MRKSERFVVSLTDFREREGVRLRERFVVPPIYAFID